jgi:hypothetical protein
MGKRGLGIVFAPYSDHWRQMRKICFLELLSAKHIASFAAIREDETARFMRSVFVAPESDPPLVNLPPIHIEPPATPAPPSPPAVLPSGPSAPPCVKP